MDSLKLIGAGANNSIDKQIEIFCCFFFQPLISVQMESKSAKKAQVADKEFFYLLNNEAVYYAVFQ